MKIKNKVKIFFSVLVIIITLLLLYPTLLKNIILLKWNPNFFLLKKVQFSADNIIIKLENYSCNPMETYEAEELNELIKSINGIDILNSSIVITCRDVVCLFNIELKKFNGEYKITKFECIDIEVYLDALSCFDLSCTEELLYKGEQICDNIKIFESMPMLKKIELHTSETIFDVQFDKIIDTLPQLKQFRFVSNTKCIPNNEQNDNFDKRKKNALKKHPDCKMSFFTMEY